MNILSTMHVTEVIGYRSWLVLMTLAIDVFGPLSPHRTVTGVWLMIFEAEKMHKTLDV